MSKLYGLMLAVLLTTSPGLYAADEKRPWLSVHEVIERAEAYVLEREIDVSDRFISMVQYTQGPGQRSFWMVTYLPRSAEAQGHALIVSMIQDGTINHRYTQ